MPQVRMSAADGRDPRNLITRLDHAAYVGCELARTEWSLRTGEPYVQDRALGEVMPQGLTSGVTAEPCGCHFTLAGRYGCEKTLTV
jgi:uncharacterized protein DUF4346